MKNQLLMYKKINIKIGINMFWDEKAECMNKEEKMIFCG